MKIIIASTLLVFISTPLIASNTSHELTKEQEYNFFIKNGLPVPGSGVHIIPASKIKNILLIVMEIII